MKLGKTLFSLVSIGLLLAITVHAQPGPTVTVIVRGAPGTGATARQVPVIVENRGANPVSLRSGVQVQQQVNGQWQNVSAAGLMLRATCNGPPPASCVTLAGSSTLTTAPWIGNWGDSQCICTRCGPAPAGTYRFVVSTCDGHPIEGASFVLPPR